MAVINGSTNSSNWTYKLDVYNIGEPNINNNNSVMRVDVWIGRASSANRSWIAGNWNGHVSINWETNDLVQIPISGTIPYQTWLNPGEWYLIAGGVDFTIKHNDDGEKSIRVTSQVTQTEFTPGYCVADGWVTLVTIPRGTDIPAISSAYVEGTVTLNLSPKINNAKHSVKLTIPNGNNILFPKDSKWLQTNGSLGSNEVLLSDKTLQMVIDSSYYKQFDGGSLSRVGLWLYTYNNNTFVDSDLEYIKLSCDSSRCTPVIDATVADTNEVTLALTNDANTIIANASKVLITPTIQVSDPDDTNAWVTSKSVDGTVFTTDTALIHGPTKKDFLLSVTNNRGFTGQKTVSATGNLIPYVKLTFNIDSLYRPEPTGNEIVLKYNGKYFAGEFTNESATSNKLFVGNTLTYSNIVCAFPDNLWELMGSEDTSVDILTTDQYKLYYYVATSTDANQTVYGVALVSLTEPDTYFLELYNASGAIGETPTVYTNSSDLIMNADFGVINSINNSDTIVYPYITKITVEEAVKNELTLTWWYKLNKDSEYTLGGTLSPTIDADKNTYSGEVTLGDIFDYQNQYDFRFFYKDKLVGINDDVFESGSVTRGIPVFWWTADSFHVQGNLYVEGEINPTN